MPQFNYEVGQKVHTVQPGSDRNGYKAGEVIRVTRSGQAVVRMDYGAERRFDKNGNEIDGIHGAGSSYRNYLDNMPFEERRADIEKTERQRVAAILLRSIEVNRGVNPAWSKEHQLEEVSRIERLVSEARRAIEAI